MTPGKFILPVEEYQADIRDRVLPVMVTQAGIFYQLRGADTSCTAPMPYASTDATASSGRLQLSSSRYAHLRQRLQQPAPSGSVSVALYLVLIISRISLSTFPWIFSPVIIPAKSKEPEML
jgi:hypothetical protein